MFRKLLLVVCCVSLLIFAGCEDKEKIQMQSDLASQKATIQDLQMGLEAARVENTQVRTDLYNQNLVIDSLGEVSQTLSGQLNSTRRALKDEGKRSDSLVGVIAGMQPALDLLPQVQDSLAREIAARQSAEAECDSLNVVVVNRDALIASIKPWYDMYRYNATERNWFEKLWGADKKNPPGFSEPVF